MHIVYLNPHADDFIAKPISFAIAKRRALRKYAYLFDGAIESEGEVDVLVDGSLSSLLPQRVFMWLPRFLRLCLLKIELFLWLRLNQLQEKVNVHWNLEQLSPSSVLYLFSYKNCVAAFHERLAIIEFFHKKVINLNHYFIATKEKAQNIAKLTNVTLATEADLRNNSYFREFFKEEYPFIILPFQVNERFRVETQWEKRKQKCAATGSFHNLHEERPKSRYSDFITFFNLDSYHPVRKLIYMNRDKLSDVIECKISPYREKKRNILVRLIARFFDSAQKQYFSFNIVDFYNNHSSALIGEEVHGLPAVGAFEAMACGCVLIAQSEYYNGLELEEGKHYLSHNGSLESIRLVIEKIAETPDKSQKIAKNGTEYVKKHCRSELLWNAFIQKLNTK